MKIIYKTLLLCVCGYGLVGSANAQQDTTLNRRVSVEREYTPVIQDASKINTVPAMQESAPLNTNVKYVTDTPALGFSSYPIQDTGSGDAATTVDFSKKRGYFIFGVGHNINLDGRAGYRILGTETDQLDIFASYNSANSDIDYLNQSYEPKSIKAKYSDAYGKIKYKHSFEPSTLYINVSYLNSMYNYYGNNFGLVSVPTFYDNQQNVNIFGGEAGLKSNDISEFKYLAELRYHRLSNKYGPTVADKGVKGNLLEGIFGLGATWDVDKTVGVEFGALHQSLEDVKFVTAKDAFHNFTSLKAKAFFNFEGGNWNVSLGAKLNYAIDVKNKFVIAPDIKANIFIAERNSLYATVTGGINDNHFVETFIENRYLIPNTRVGYSSTLYDAVAGFKLGALQGFEFDIFGGYKHTKDDHLYLFTYTDTWRNVSAPTYANVSEGHIGAQVKTKLIPYTDLRLGAKYYFYDVKYVNDRYSAAVALPSTEKEAWGKPKFALEADVDVNPVDRLYLNINYIYKGGRKTYLLSSANSTKMKDMNEFNFRTEYKFIDWLSVNLAFNNILNQKYETTYGYTHQGFNVMGGVSLVF